MEAGIGTGEISTGGWSESAPLGAVFGVPTFTNGLLPDAWSDLSTPMPFACNSALTRDK